MLLRLDNNKDLKKLNNMHLMKGFVGVSDHVIIYVSYMWDYKSIFRDLPEEGDIREKAIREKIGIFADQKDPKLFTDWKTRNKRAIGKAKQTLMSLQYDDDYELYKSYKKQMTQISLLLSKKNKTEKETAQALAMSKELLNLREIKMKLEEIVGERIKQEEKAGNKTKNALQIYMEEQIKEDE